MDWIPFFTGIGVAAFLFLGLVLWRASVARYKEARKVQRWREREDWFRQEILRRHDEGIVAQERQAKALGEIARALEAKKG